MDNEIKYYIHNRRNNTYFTDKTSIGVAFTTDKNYALVFNLDVAKQIKHSNIKPNDRPFIDIYTTDDELVDMNKKPKKRHINKTDLDKRTKVYCNSKGKCAICNKDISLNDFTIDHIIPSAKGGKNNIENLQATCKQCNSMKSDMLPWDFKDKINSIVLNSIDGRLKRWIIRKILKGVIK